MRDGDCGRESAPEPFPGAKPYDEKDRDFFFGRDKDKIDIAARILRERITILTGDSAIGKTSLLRAGIIPLLRRERCRTEAERGSGQPRVGLTLSLRNWGGGKGASADTLIRRQLPAAIERIKEWSQADHELLDKCCGQMVEKGHVTEVIAELSEASGGLILVLDQIEEVLRARQSLAQELIGIIRDLYEFTPGVKIVLALRKEYHQDLRGLESVVGPLYSRTKFLRVMKRKTVEEAIHQAAMAARIDLPPEIVSVLLGWNSVREEVEVESDSRREVGRHDAPDLLRLQTVVRELIEFCPEDPEGRGKRITKQVLDEYVGTRSPRDVMGRALERWIIAGLTKPAPAREGHLTSQINEPDQTALVFRIVARLAPFLSSGDYKVAQEEVDLFRGALREDLASLLGIEDRTFLQKVASAVRERGASFADGLNISPSVLEVARANLAGAANRWQVDEALREIFVVFKETLERLHNRNIVKPLHLDGRSVWELVHDGFGAALWALAEERRDTWDDCRFSLVACRGVSPILITKPVKEEAAIRYLNWRGCLVKPLAAEVSPDSSGLGAFTALIHEASTKGEVVCLSNARFEHCDLRGTIFEGCVFFGGVFRRCRLDGTVFRDCWFLAGGADDGVRFVECSPGSLGMLGGGAVSICFERCHMVQPTFANLLVAGPLRFSSSSMYLGLFDGLKLQDGAKLSIDGDVDWKYCAWDKTFETWAGPVLGTLLSEENRNGRLAGGRKQPEVDVRGRKDLQDGRDIATSQVR